MKKLISKSLLAVLLITMTALSFAGCKKKDNAETIRIGVLTGHSLPVIATVNGYFKDGVIPCVIWCANTGTLYFSDINRNEVPEAGEPARRRYGPDDLV